MQSKPVRRLLTGLAMIASGILPFVLLEVGLRAFHYGYPTGFFVPVTGKTGHASNERFGWRFFPASIARVPVVSYVPGSKDASHYRIFILGDSAAMGIPEPAFSFGRVLRVMLESRYPTARFDIVNTAMTAINSHALLPIAEDCARLQPDLFIVLAGNNEVVGPYGPGTVLSGYSPSLSLIRASVLFKATATAQLMEQALKHFHPEQKPAQWAGMGMFAGHEVTRGDPRMANVYASFRANLERVRQIAASAHASLIFSTVPVNLKDTAPFASRHKLSLSEGDRGRWQKLYESGMQKVHKGNCADAIPDFRRAMQLDDEFADLHFRLGGCLLKMGYPADARVSLTAARDLDALRFRADSEINSVIREAAARSRPPAGLVDAERNLSQLPGNDLFYEHVHLRFSGNYLLARAMLSEVEARIPLTIRTQWRDMMATETEVAAALGFTEWDRDKSEMEMLAMRQQPPFTAQSDYGENQPSLERQLSALRAKWSSPEKLAGLQQHLAYYQAALQREPDDLELRELFAELLSKSGDQKNAESQYRRLMETIPDIPRWRANLAYAHLQQGKPNEAQSEAQAALQLDPNLTAAQFTMGALEERAGRTANATESYQRVLVVNSGYAEAHLRLGILLGRAGRTREAVDHYLAYVHLAPGSAQAENNIGVLLIRLGEVNSAVPHYREALRLQPNFPEAANNLGAALERLGRTAEAIGYYRMALTLRPEFPEARRHLENAISKQQLQARS